VRLRLAVGLCVALLVAFVALRPRAPRSGGPPPAAAPTARPASVASVASPSPAPVAELRPDRLRSRLVAATPSAAWPGSLVQDAMAAGGDSDPRLLAGLAAVGVRPTVLLPVALAVDPWLAAGLVDLERQVVAHCAGCDWEWSAAMAGLARSPEVACVAVGMSEGDPDACGVRAR
jgi:hypothetical protein